MAALGRILLAVASLVVAQESTAQTVVPVEQTPYHMPVFSNEYVTLLNVLIPPGRTSGYHRHSIDSLGVLIEDTKRTRQVLGEPLEVGELRPPGSVSFSFYDRQPAVHEVVVTGDNPFHNIVVELLETSGSTAGNRDGVPGYTHVLSNERVEVWRLVLEPGETAPAITQTAPGIRIVVSGGEIVERLAGKPDRGIAPRRGDFFWQEAGVTRSVANTGTTRVELVEVEIK